MMADLAVIDGGIAEAIRDAIHRKGRVAWLDVKDNGEFVLYHAPHGTVPGNIPQTPR